MALVKGICKNFGECDLADNREVQEVEKTNFVCEECGKPLHPIDGGGSSGKDGGKGPNKKLIGIIAAAVLGAGVIGGVLYLILGNDEITKPNIELTLNHTDKTLKVGEKDTLVATITPADTKATFIWQASKKSNAVDVSEGIVTAKEEGESKVQIKVIVGNDTLKAICTYKVEKADSEIIPEPDTAHVVIDSVTKAGGQKVNTSPNKLSPINPSYGKYTGDRNTAGIPNGFGEVTFTKRKLVSGDTYAEPGYKIRNARFINGKLQSGTLYDTDGIKVCFIDSNNNL